MTESRPAPHPETTTVDDGLVHIACEHDPYTVLCGAPTSPAEKVDDAADCPDCFDIEALYDRLGVCCEQEGTDA